MPIRPLVRLRPVLPILIGVPLVLVAWVVSLLVLTWFASAGVPVAVLARGGRDATLAAVIAADGKILTVRGDTVIAVADDAWFVARLYRAGAVIVIQANGGCGFAPKQAPVAASAA